MLRGAWRPRAAGSASPKGSLPSSVRRPSKGPAPFVCLNRMHNFQTPPLQWKFGSERVGVKNVKQDSITIFILEKPSSKYVYLIRTITAQEQNLIKNQTLHKLQVFSSSWGASPAAEPQRPINGADAPGAGRGRRGLPAQDGTGVPSAARGGPWPRLPAAILGCGGSWGLLRGSKSWQRLG